MEAKKRKPLALVKIPQDRHKEVKLFAVKNNRNMYEILDIACKEYLESQDKKGGGK